MTDIINYENKISFSGMNNIIIDETIQLFRLNYWYVVQYTITKLYGNCSLSLCNYNMIETTTGDKRYILKITDIADNFIKINLGINSAMEIDNLKIDILGRLDFAINRNVFPKSKLINNDHLDQETFMIPENENTENVVVWNGTQFIFYSYDHIELQTNSDTIYFRLMTSGDLSTESIQRLNHWAKQVL